MAPDLKEYDEEQVRLMEEMCIVVDENDKRVSADSKKTCRFIKKQEKKKIRINIDFACRSSHDKYQHWSFASCLQCLFIQF